MEGLFELLQKGGLAMYPLLLLSLLSWAVIVERVMNLRSSSYRSRSLRELKPLLAGKDLEGAIKLLSTDNSHMGVVLRELLEGYREGKLSKEDMLKNLDLEISMLVPRLEKNLALLSTVASTAPLIGLFGTITGLIKVFSAFAVANPEQAMVLLSKGISEALVAAATGLAVAIPALLAYWLFRIWGNGILSKIEEEVFEVIRVLR
ncbi:MAG: MotA/TolQ/ExbB proton channel family protein [Aquificaceae bacterium]|nr:MotA/TolQ/ExbB proton channel family protein [Aquificaceae bacterium]MCS7195928.1 MotA/TolQ/ExbB proton channel family protein [Aquificaceae bacterium]MCX7989095.1 MotA/TolQ/ExbB proton channel family protein [Aquificaceae bacterium]MDW8032983.1 MotA/TolQ/ExbB proton channel family protein [Aquificaceae bacterium]MDW8293926.1 MotA/TolQ/ExbB proton channel family protein [Aquificaceae bacterium]